MSKLSKCMDSGPILAAHFILIFVVLFTPEHSWADPFSAIFAEKPRVQGESDLLHKVAIFKKDDRKKVPAKYQKLARGIGLLFNQRTNTVCTAFCVAPEIIATASHCFYQSRRRFPDLYFDWAMAGKSLTIHVWLGTERMLFASTLSLAPWGFAAAPRSAQRWIGRSPGWISPFAGSEP